ncbi:MAG: ABC transporter ATP-binding protein [Lachnospiraceae bacterium]
MKDKKTLHWIYEQSKSQFFLIFILVLGNAAFAVCGVVLALASRGVIDGATSGDLSKLISRALLLLGIIVLQLVLRLVCNYISAYIQGKLEIAYKSHLLEKILERDYISISSYHSGEILNRCTSDVNVVRDAVTGILPNTIGLVTRLVAAFAVLCYLEKSFALLFGVAGLLLLLIKNVFRGWLKKMHKQMQEADGKVRSFIQEIVSNVLVVKVFGVEKKMNEKATALQQDHFRIRMKRTKVSVIANSGISFSFSLGYLYALVWSAYRLLMHTISFGTLTAVLQLINQVQSPFSSLSSLMPQYYAMLASAERIIELEQLPKEPLVNTGVQKHDELYHNMEKIIFSDLSFRYGERMESVFEHANLTIQKGDFVAIGGVSGIGKSTLLKLLLGVLRPDEGEIFLENRDGSRIPVDKAVRPLFAYVPQGSIILSGTIRENLMFINQDATEEELQQAIKISCCEDFIRSLPMGLDTVIGEKGHGLSEGQIQRLAVARALVSRSPVLLLDESTSALDEVTEGRLLKNLRDMADCTLITISHKRAAFEICNRILKIEEGTIVDFNPAME